jgi:geranylgeranyl pyrophosphate synthase
MLGACAYQAFRQDPARSGDFQALAVAVECFHKASLIHDDIEDADSFRYGQKTLHERVGVPMALNVGDFLLGEGYRLIGRCQASDETRSAMLNVAAGGHRSLCVGQGEELWWLRHPRPMQPTEVIEIFRRKTAPAFEVALSLGAMLAGVRNGVWSSLTAYSEALGIAYQIQDDLDDWRELEAGSTQMKLGPSILLALAYESADERQRPTIQQAWSAGEPTKTAHQELVWLLRELHVERQARTLLESYKRQAVRALDGIEQPLPKLLLRRLLSRILGVVHKAQVHEELPSGDAPGRPFGAESAA